MVKATHRNRSRSRSRSRSTVDFKTVVKIFIHWAITFSGGGVRMWRWMRALPT